MPRREIRAGVAPGPREPVRITDTQSAKVAIWVRATVAGVAAGAGALATVAVGDSGIEAQQMFAALAAAAAAVGGVIGVSDRHVTAEAPKEELRTMRRDQELEK